MQTERADRARVPAPELGEATIEAIPPCLGGLLLTKDVVAGCEDDLHGSRRQLQGRLHAELIAAVGDRPEHRSRLPQR